MTYAVTTTTRVATLTNGLQNETARVRLAGRLEFNTYAEAASFAEDFASLRCFAYVKPATEAPTLKEGQAYVEVVAA